jgi:hypothetical protein
VKGVSIFREESAAPKNPGKRVNGVHRRSWFQSGPARPGLSRVILCDQMADLISNETLILLGILSVVFFVGSLIAIPILLVCLPVDYFDDDRPRGWFPGIPMPLRITVLILKNLIGIVLVLAGLAMLVLPGQGLLTILIGMSLVDFRGKRKLERRIVGQPAVLRMINSIRMKYGKPPLAIREPAAWPGERDSS